MIAFTLAFEGHDADEHQIDLYDVSEALIGFQRSLALTTHLVLNGQVITQAPSLKNARIIALPAEEGSWKLTAALSLMVGLYNVGTADKDTVLGHLMYSAYDYVVSETLGCHVDFDKTLGQQYEELKKYESAPPNVQQHQFDSVIEKCENAIRKMHRPIVESETASKAEVLYETNHKRYTLSTSLDADTYAYIALTRQIEKPEEVVGRISSYNVNTYKGRIYVYKEQRPIPFELAPHARYPRSVGSITNSLSVNARDRFNDNGTVSLTAFRNEAKSGRLKGYYVVEVN